MVKPVLTVLLFVLLVVAWPLMYWVSNYVWLGQINSAVNYELMVFVPMGVISSLGVIMQQLFQKYAGCLVSDLLGYMGWL
ncbi:hypothetical protein ACH42_10150 [Endozoicomonas sp. (ex Bugula neritina AB1)]|nr:hypothetical protein ACH42_10150 [Endozoicomonas sp. (ex Bugula neritina AB1)]